MQRFTQWIVLEQANSNVNEYLEQNLYLVNTQLTLPGPSAGVSGSLDSYCSLKPLCSGMGEVEPARTSSTLLPPSLALCCHYPVSKCCSASIVVTSTVRVNTIFLLSVSVYHSLLCLMPEKTVIELAVNWVGSIKISISSCECQKQSPMEGKWKRRRRRTEFGY